MSTFKLTVARLAITITPGTRVCIPGYLGTGYPGTRGYAYPGKPGMDAGTGTSETYIFCCIKLQLARALAGGRYCKGTRMSRIYRCRSKDTGSRYLSRMTATVGINIISTKLVDLSIPVPVFKPGYQYPVPVPW